MKFPPMTFEERLDPALLEAYAASPEIDLGRNIPKLRFLIERYEAPLRAALPPIPEVTVTDHLVPGRTGNPDVRVRTYEPDGRAAGSAAMFWIHGGGMVIGTIDGDDFMCKTWARDFGCLVASVDYRLAPEHQYPAHIDDCYTGLQLVPHPPRRLPGRSFTPRHRWRERGRRARRRHRAPRSGSGRGAALLPVPRLPDDRRPRRDRIDARDHDYEGMEPTLEPDRMEVVPRRSGRRRRCAALRGTGASDRRRPAGPAARRTSTSASSTRSATRTSPTPHGCSPPACRASCTSRQARSTDRRWRFRTRRAHGESAPTGATPSAACSPDGTSSRPSAWRAKRPASRGCTGSSVGHGQPPKPVRR